MVAAPTTRRRRGQEDAAPPACPAGSIRPPTSTPTTTNTISSSSLLLSLVLLVLAQVTEAWHTPFPSPSTTTRLNTHPQTHTKRYPHTPTTLHLSNKNVLPDQQDSSSSSSSSSSSNSNSGSPTTTTTTTTITTNPPSTTTESLSNFSPFLDLQRRRPGLLFEEEVNFCLIPVNADGTIDTTNPQVARATTVNSFANQAAKKILIGVDCCFDDMADAVKARLRADYGGGDEEVEGACGFIDAISALSPCSDLQVAATKGALQPMYADAYARVVETLLSTNCEFRMSENTGAKLSDKAASLAAVNAGTDFARKNKEAKVRPRDRDICLSLYDTITGAPTKTKVLNRLSNRVSRTMLYGDEDDIAKLTQELEAGKAKFLEEWMDNRADSDEGVYYESLIAHLTGGLEAPAPPAMGGGYSNAYQRFMTLLVQELGTRSAPVDGELFDSFVRWESTLRKNLTQEMWDPHPKELTGSWMLMDTAPAAMVQQQQTLQPQGSLSSGGTVVPVSMGNKEEEGRKNPVTFRKDGTLRLPPELGLDGYWRFEPGPTHLDTIRFDIRLGTPDNRVLSYTGYVDRGQRIETRFSKRPIKMKGRVVLRIRGENRYSSKFTMELCRKNMLGLEIGGGGGGEEGLVGAGRGSGGGSGSLMERD